MNQDFSYFDNWKGIPDSMTELMFAEFAANGAKNIVVTETVLERILADPVYFVQIRGLLKKYGLRFFEAHGLWGSVKDLNGSDRQYRTRMIQNHKTAMGYCSDAECRTYTVHIGAQCCYEGDYDIDEKRKLAVDTLSELILEAEKLGIIIAVENSFEPTNTPDEVLYYMGLFNSKALGVCYDSGHANVMRGKGKNPADYKEDLLLPWKNHISHDDRALEKLAPYIVTCHLHDNDGYHDQHMLPGTGTTDWADIISRLSKCPRIESMQSEVNAWGDHIPVASLCRTFDSLKQYL